MKKLIVILLYLSFVVASLSIENQLVRINGHGMEPMLKSGSYAVFSNYNDYERGIIGFPGLIVLYHQENDFQNRVGRIVVPSSSEFQVNNGVLSYRDITGAYQIKDKTLVSTTGELITFPKTQLKYGEVLILPDSWSIDDIKNNIIKYEWVIGSLLYPRY